MKKIKEIKKIWILVPAIVIILLILFFVVGGLKKNKTSPSQMEITEQMMIFTVEAKDNPLYIEIDDEVEPSDIKSLNFPESGIVSKVYFENGDMVNKGDLIAKLDSTDIEQSILEAEKLLKTAEINGNGIDIAIYSKQLESLKNQLERCSLYAPYTGYLADFDLDENSVASAGTEFGSLYDLSTYISTVYVAESDIFLIAVGNQVVIQFNALKNKEYTGYVSKIYKSSVTTDGVVTYPVEIKFDKIDNNFRPGLTYSGKIIYSTGTKGIYIPKVSVATDEKGLYVALVKGKIAVKQYITIGEELDKTYSVSSGLNIGDEILLLNMFSLKEMQNSTGSSSNGGPGMGGPPPGR